MQLELQEYRQSETALDIYSPLAKDVARERLRDFLVRQPSNESSVVISGTVSTHQTTVRVRPRRFSLPWRGTFRGAFLARDDGTMITRKFDSNWSLLFVGYPILLGVVVNLGLTVVAGHGSGHLGEFALLVIFAGLLCVYLNWIETNDNASIVAAICYAISGRIESDSA